MKCLYLMCDLNLCDWVQVTFSRFLIFLILNYPETTEHRKTKNQRNERIPSRCKRVFSTLKRHLPKLPGKSHILGLF